MSEAYELANLCEKKPIPMRDIGQNVLKMHEFKKLSLHEKKLTMMGGIRQNMFDAHESIKLN